MDKKHKREARSLCLQILFANNFSNGEFDDLFSNFYLNQDSDLEEISYSKKQIEYASRLYSYVVKEKDSTDKLIESKLVNWEMNRLAMIDRMILRMSITEMLFLDDIPPKVSITEAVEIAKQFSSEDSSGFINGIMDAIYNEKYSINNKKKI